MVERLSSGVERLLKVPPPPQPPAGSAESTRIFRAARGFLYRRIVEWTLAQLGALTGIFFSFSFAASEWIPDRVTFFLGSYVRFFELAALGLFAAQVVFSFLVLLLDYRLRYYIVTDRSLRIREGILRVKEQTVSFANIQNVSVRQGPLQRLLGIADVEIRTAGGGDKGDDSDGSDNLHRAVFKGVDNAGEIRDIIRADLRRLRDSGLGDEEPAEAVDPAETEDVSLLDASRLLADAAHSLRLGLAARSRSQT
jgi:uncharacterized membrane protein YdbT with pleckstrin-like domain